MTQIIHPHTKIFFIGFNRTATISLHVLMRKSSIRSAHWTEGGPLSPKLAVEIDRRLCDGGALKAYLNRWTAFSDITGGLPGQKARDGNRHFRLFHELFPDSYFVLNDRDTEAWVRSRFALQGGRYLAEQAALSGVAVSDLPAVWRDQKERHTAAVLDYFRDYERFLHFKIDTDAPSALTDFLRPQFLVPVDKWRHLNKSRT